MKNLKHIPFQKRAMLLFIACSLSGCSTLQSWFPDKEKDYQFTTELPPLVIPPDLVQKPSLPTHVVPVDSTAASKIAKTVQPIGDKKLLEVVKPAFEMATELANRPIDTAETLLNRNEIQISLTHENVPTLNLNVPSARAWRIVGKALSRSGVEVTNRDQENGQIHVLMIDSQTKTEHETSLFDDTISVFNPFSTPEQSYVLQFRETNSKTAITVLTSELQPITDNSSEKLLSLLFDAIKTDLSK